MIPGRAQELAATWQAARPRLIQVAYAILGTIGEAEDVVAEAWLRLAAADADEPIRDVEGWGVVAVGRASLDSYRSARRRREVYVGPWLPEPLITTRSDDDPADRVTLDDSVSFALLVVLETLSPAERTTWVLHDLFGLTFSEVAEVVGRTPAAVRQLAGRARAHLQDRAPRFPVDRVAHQRAVGRFLDAAAGGRIDQLLAALDPAVVLTSDGGGVVTAARRPVVGAEKVARFLFGLLAKAGAGDDIGVVDVNGFTGIAITHEGRLDSVVSLTVDRDRIIRIDMIRAPAKLINAARAR